MSHLKKRFLAEDDEDSMPKKRGKTVMDDDDVSVLRLFISRTQSKNSHILALCPYISQDILVNDDDEGDEDDADYDSADEYDDELFKSAEDRAELLAKVRIPAAASLAPIAILLYF